MVLFVMAPDTVISLSAATVCKVVVPLKLLAFTVKAELVLRTAALFVSETVAMLLPMLVAVTFAPLTKLNALVLAEIAPLRVIAPVPPNDVAVDIVIAPLSEPAEALELIKAPLALIPEPLRFKALPKLNPLRSRV